VSFDEAVRLADEHLAGAPFRYLEAEDGAGGQELEEPFRAAGWEVECEVLMALETPPEAPATAHAVTEPSEERMLALMRRWIVEDEKPQPEDLEHHVESVRRRARAAGERHFGIEEADGELVSITNLRADGTVAQVENVYTAPKARGRGYARTLVSHVTLRALDARPELVIITADDNDWPKQLYARLGFAPVGRTWLFHRRV
jgi:predicted GNAT family acetyltransferase